MKPGCEIDARWCLSQWYNALYFIAGGVASVKGIAVAFKGLGTGIRWLEKISRGVWAGGLMLILWNYLEVRCFSHHLSAERVRKGVRELE